MKLLVTGATGYVGGRLVPRLLDKGYSVRSLNRNPNKVLSRWENVEVVKGDVLDPESLINVFDGIDAAFYLIHSLGEGFVEKDLKAAENFSKAAKKAGVKRIIYLGGLGRNEDKLSDHLKSRQQTGNQLRKFGPPITEFRAGIIVGSGSLSFEMIRYLTERLVAMITPSWVKTKVQPIAIRDVLRYLIEALEKPETENEIIEIGGKDVLTYKQLMEIYAEIRGLRRYMLEVPLLSPRLSSYWIGLVTPLPPKVARPLVDGLKNEIVVNNNNSKKFFDFEPIGYEEAVRLAIKRENEKNVETIWSEAYPLTDKNGVIPVELKQKEGMIIENREIIVNTSPEDVYSAFISVGGNNGWYANWLWKLRGYLDRLFGGIGMRLGRRNSKDVHIGEAIDFWRVEAVEKNHLLRLHAEMKLPGEAWLQFKVEKIDAKRSKLIQTAFFEPKGLLGILYWYSIYFLHGYIFGGMIKELKKKAETM